MSASCLNEHSGLFAVVFASAVLLELDFTQCWIHAATLTGTQRLNIAFVNLFELPSSLENTIKQ